MAAASHAHPDQRPRPARYRSRSPRGMSSSSLNSPVNIAIITEDSSTSPFHNTNNYNNTSSTPAAAAAAAVSLTSPQQNIHNFNSLQSQSSSVSSSSAVGQSAIPQLEADIITSVRQQGAAGVSKATKDQLTIHANLSRDTITSTATNRVNHLNVTKNNNRSKSKERPIVPIYAHWHSLQPSTPPPPPHPPIVQAAGVVAVATADQSSVPAAPTSSASLTAEKQDSVLLVPNINSPQLQPQQQQQPQTHSLPTPPPHTRSFSANLLQIPTFSKTAKESSRPNRYRSHSHGNFDYHTKRASKTDRDSPPSSPQPSTPPATTTTVAGNRLESPASASLEVRASHLRSKSLQNLLSTTADNRAENSTPPRPEHIHQRGMRRISKFFRSSSGENEEKSSPPRNRTKLISKSTSHLPLSHSHPLPSDIPDITQLNYRRAATIRDDRQPTARLGSRPVTRDGITIPPPLPSLNLSHDVVGAGSETGNGGAGNNITDPGNNVPTTLISFDGQRERKSGLSGTEQSVSSTSHGSRPTTPQNNPATENKLQKKRLSMMPGRKKPSSRDGESPDKIKAWKLELGSDGLNGEEYDFASLDRGAEVSDVWDPKGNTMVYLSPPALPGHPEPQPSFRINSSPLMFASMAGYIQDMNPSGVQAIESIQEEPVGADTLEPNDLFLSIPTSQLEGEEDWGQLSDIIGNNREPTGITPGITASPEIIDEENPSQSAGSSQRSSLTPSSTATNDSYQVRYKLYYSRVAQEERNDHGDRRSSRIARLLDARNLFAFLDKRFLVASSERINAFRILEKLYLQLFIEPAVTSTSSGNSSPSAGSPPGSPRMGGKIGRRGQSTPPRTPNSPGYPQHNTLIDDLPTKILLAESHLDYYIDELRLDDVRGLSSDDSDLKNRGFRDSLEAMYLGEKWRSSRLFLEGYLHTVGRWEDFKAAKHPLVDFLLPMTLSKLDRAAFDLENREREINERFAGPVAEFAFPAMFSGVGKYPRYKRWREGFSDTQELFVKHVKWVYGSWPPKAGKSGKGGGSGGEKGGLNREVLKRVERDMGRLWDLLVDWERPRYPPGGFGLEDQVAGTGVIVDGENDLRTLLEEFDRASPPVQPRPMFDMPRLAQVSTTNDPKKEGKKEKSKKVKGEAVTKAVHDSWNSLQPAQPSVTDTAIELMQKFKEMELEFAQNKILGSSQGRTIEDIQDYRKGIWIFIYAVLQSLPMLVVDAPIVRWSEGCEYFLCVGWKHPVLPWEDRDAVTSGAVSGAGKVARGQGAAVSKRSSMMWASAPGGGIPSPVLPPSSAAYLNNDPNQLSELAAAMMPECVEDDEVGAAYHRSYCWVMAAAWCVKWEEEQRKKKEEDLRQVLDREREQWQESERGRLEKRAMMMGGGDFQGSDYGSGEGSIAHGSVGEPGRITPGTPRNGTPPQIYYYTPTAMMHPAQGYDYGYAGYQSAKEGRRTSSPGSRSEGSLGSVGGGRSGNGNGNGRRVVSGGHHMYGVAAGPGGVSVDDIPEVLLPTTKDKRMSTYGSGNWGMLGAQRR